MEMEKGERVKIVPVLLRETVAWEQAPFGHLAPLPPDRKPVMKHSSESEGCYAVARGVRDLLAQGKLSLAPVFSRSLGIQPPRPHPVRSIPRPRLVSELYQRLTGPEVSALVLTGIWGQGK